MSNDYILAIDAGTQSIRALLFDASGHLVAKSQVMLEAYFSAQPGWAEHDVEEYWQALCQACQRLWAQTHAPRGAIKGVALTTQRGTMINLDKHGQPLRPAIVWLDQRKAARLPVMPWWWRAAFSLVGVKQTAHTFQHQAYSNWIMEQQPDIWARTEKYLLLSGYLNYRLCGQFVDSIGAQVGYIPFDYKHHAWAPAWDWKWAGTQIDRQQLPELVAPGTVMGEISRAATEATGIPAGTPLLAAAADKACEVIGAGCLTPDIGCLSYGTTATINTTHRKYVETSPFIPPYPSAVPGHYSCEIQIFRGFWMVSWFKEQFGHPERNAARELGIETEALFDELVNAVPPGSMGLMLQPFWSPGVKSPGPEAKGAIIGFGDVHTRAHLYRAILEGLAYALKDGRERLEKRSGVAIEHLRVSGGGSQSDAAMQITADIFDLPTARPHLYETSGLGAAIDASVGLGLHPDFATAVRAMTRVGREFEPAPHNVRLYRDLYERVYQRMYRQLKPLYEEIGRITGYPAPP